MSTSHNFGGPWTDAKLERIRKYLSAYTTVFTQNERAAHLRTYYVDAFAGTGYRDVPTEENETSQVLFPTELDITSVKNDAESLKKGSAHIALQTSPPFDGYVFIEQRAEFANALAGLKSEFPQKAERISILPGEANETLKEWVKQVNWKTHRAVVFLDPYGMEVDWSTIEAIAATKAIDLWILFPLAQAVNRLLTRGKLPNDGWSAKLTRFFGTDEWREAFYKPIPQSSLFPGDMDQRYSKDTDFDAIGEFFVQRLSTIFAKTANNPLPLFNSRNVPLFLLCFAAANPRGATTAVKIAQDILKK